MPADLFLGIDIGTWETKGVVTDARGTVLAEAARGHRLRVPQPGWAEHDADQDWWGDLVHVSRALLAQGIDPARIACMATSAIGPCMLPVDAEGRPLMPAALYGIDTRATAEVALLEAAIGAHRIMRTCGTGLSSQSVGPKILWLRHRRPDLFVRTARILTSTSYLVQRLTGAQVIDHYTAAGFAPLYDLGRRDWTTALTAGIVGPGLLPRLGWTTEIAGRVTPGAAGETGLAAGTPVTFGTIDAAAEAVSVGVAAPGQLMMMYGSSMFCIALTDRLLADPGLWAAPWLFPGEHASMAGLPTAGTLTHWFREQFARDLPRDTAFATLSAEAAAAPPATEGLVALPYFSGVTTPLFDAGARGAFFGLDLTHDRGAMFRALIEGVAMATRHILETWRNAGLPVPVARAVGGGTRNALWLQAIADYGRLTQELCTRTTGAAYGDAFLAALAVGAVDRGDIARWNPVARAVAPAPSPALDAHYARFRALYAATRALPRPGVASGDGGAAP